MSYLVFARKFRPQTFEEVMGQDPITRTLLNAMEQQRIPQSFLFSGPRGVGKTSTARILAKALNCAKNQKGQPCGKCLSCTEIAQGNSLDVLEIDGASNRGIDEIRNLRETVKFKPVSGKYKVYIIDEVHMLTTEAFNALLKTLEEPPEHVKFIFATTEPHKVPLTILSRCQRFNFKRISTAEIVRKLEHIAKAEKLKYEKNALFMIAKASEGALRDAESLLDQLASFAEDKINEEDVLMALGLASEEIYFKVLQYLASKKIIELFTLVEELYLGGKDLVQFSKGMLEIFRHLLVIQCMETAQAPASKGNRVEEFIEMSPEGIEILRKHKDDFTRGQLLLGISLLSNLQNSLRRNLMTPKLLVETTLLKLFHLDGLKEVESLSSLQKVASVSTPKSVTPSPVMSSQGSRKVNEVISKTVVTKSENASVLPRRSESGAQAISPVSFGAPTQTTATAVASAPIGWEHIESAWPRVIEYVKSKRMSSGIFLSEAAPVEISDTVLTIGFPAEFQFHKDMLEKGSNKQLIEEAFEAVSSKKLRIDFVITRPEVKEEENGFVAPAAMPAPAESADTSKLPDIITQAMDIFDGAKIIRKD